MSYRKENCVSIHVPYKDASRYIFRVAVKGGRLNQYRTSQQIDFPTTRCVFQIHGVLQSDLKEFFFSTLNIYCYCTVTCGDISHAFMHTHAPFTSVLYQSARYVSKMVGEAFMPQPNASSDIWSDGEKQPLQITTIRLCKPSYVPCSPVCDLNIVR